MAVGCLTSLFRSTILIARHGSHSFQWLTAGSLPKIRQRIVLCTANRLGARTDESKAGKMARTKLLSEVDPADGATVLDLLQSDVGSPASPNLLRAKEELRVWFYVRGEGLGGDASEFSVLRSVQLDITSKFSGWWSGTEILFDRPFQECCLWARRLEETIRTIALNVQFVNRIGLCNACGGFALPADHGNCGWDNNVCSSCVARRQEEFKRERPNMHRRRITIRRAIHDPMHRLPPSRRLGTALYRAYRGRCQYCVNPERLRRSESCIEHIIPQAIPFEAVQKYLEKMGISEETATRFSRDLLPPTHDCVLNYTLSCGKDNTRKGGRLLHLAVLEQLLVRARSKAGKVLLYYSQETARAR